MSKNPIDKLSGFCIVTGASSGIGLELAKLAAADGCNLLLVADRDLSTARSAVEACGAASVETLEVDLGTKHGIDTVAGTVGERQVDTLIANAGHGLGHAFFEQEWNEIAHVIDTNVKGTVSLVHKIGAQMVLRDAGRILVTGSIAGDMPGAYQLVYNSTKAFVNDFCVGLANELKGTQVVVSCLMPGVTDTEFFDRAGMEDTAAGQSDSKADPAKVARDGYDALLKGETQEVSGFMNKVQDVFAGILPDELVAQMHRRLAKPER
ncbi:SDR family NAD(P)-dependent oxidoreductase [Erythrobacter sp. 3-20A1M]|uniref:SDR family NAD(P)-dependent oxidoreductase n=1 Tax=Erythrobacter sp. 3-20A1M TaxID=2653850 RepID=UPI001BFC7FCC|nr:SDR family NAD(P)-dependent oxidoreductase [Erythrobacter sp. 3-20A1M]QWC57273.1 SDR family NAD(P)-dependent oxidoreductase [Erythrobacter sp. 3-20A1M]